MKNYCEKHNQSWMEHVNGCPVCRGESMVPAGSGGVPAPVLIPQQEPPEQIGEPVQMSLFS